ncbi:nucleotidyltransferase family protein [Paludibacterium sp. THUN1379]|uniref:nucleotidyltransferase family protein n=1 Tax=Paludibacterium sp. THUN1379 TaxID=3112107 RepID=UPI003091A313|nr:nucleotidyltransferase family protein [Paludibacterium sp. THUN1379]
MEDCQRLRAIVRQNATFMQALTLLRQQALPDGWIGAGAVRSLVWDALTGQPDWRVPGDMDVCYFDERDLSADTERGYQVSLHTLCPDLPWEVCNQARVHLWYPQAFGKTVPPLRNMHEAVASWPEYATCVAVRLTAQDDIELLAPHGLEDLFALRIRHNPVRASLADFRRRLASKRFDQRWPGVHIIEP